MSKKDKYQWALGSSFPEIEDHSRKKHQILDLYLRAYIRVRTAAVPKMTDFRLTLIDGFAGGGQYVYQDSIVPGSPLIMHRAASETALDINNIRQQEGRKRIRFNINHIFIEKNQQYANFLKDVLSKENIVGENVQIINGAFYAELERITASLSSLHRDHKCIFFLDPYKCKDIYIEKCHSIMSRFSNAEVILVFTVDSLIDYLGENNTSVLDKYQIPKHIQKKMLDAKEESRNWRYLIQKYLYSYLFMKKFKYVSKYFIHSPTSHRAYWLLHMSNHYRGRDEMIKIHWQSQTDFINAEGFSILGYNPGNDIEVTGQMSFPEYRFDEDDEAQMKSYLLKAIPKLIWSSHKLYGRALPFDKLLHYMANLIPVTRDIAVDILKTLEKEKEVKVIRESERSGYDIKGNDIISPHEQKKLL